MRRALLLPLAAAAALAAPPARADTQPGAQARARQVLTQVNELDRQIERVAEAYDRSGVELARTGRKLRTNRDALRVARGNLASARRDLARLLLARYKQGETNSTLMVVLGSASLSDLIDRVDAAERLAKQDAAVIEQVRHFRARVLAERRRLTHEQQQQRMLRASLARRRTQIEGRLAERRRLLASVRDEVARLQARERARQRQLQQEAEARLARQQPSTPAQPAAVTAAAPSAGSQASAPARGHPEVVAIAMRYLGIPYRWGGAAPSTGFDCSGLVLYVYAQIGISLPHNAAMQYGYGVPVGRSDLQPGDLVFFNGLGHNGIYIGGGQFIDAPETGDVVKIENLNASGWAENYVGARRLP